MRKLVSILWILPIFICGAGAGYTLAGFGDLYSPVWWEYVLLGGGAGLFLAMAIWWAYKIT